MKYAHYDENTNKILGYYDDEIHAVLPSPNIKLTDKQWQEAINTNANYADTKQNKLIYKQKELSAEDKKQAELNELETQIKETEELIRHALLIGNDAVLDELRAEYKELLNQKEILKGEDNEKEN